MNALIRSPALALGAVIAVAAMPLAAQTLPADPASIWTLQDENASISAAKLTDRDYTNGLRLGWTSPSDAQPQALTGVGRALWGDGQLRISFDLTQQIYTPTNAASVSPPAGDRPYAGVLMGTLGLTSDTADHRSTLSLGLGLVGPAALGEEVQNGFHDLIGQKHNNGWSTQLPNEPLLEITSSRVWRLKTGGVAGLETEVLPELTAGLGTLRTYVMTGAVARIGQGLDSDFGAPRLRPGLTAGDAFARRDIGWYVFAGVDGQGVAYDTTLDGDLFQSSRSVKRVPYLGEAELGAALLIAGTRLTYTQVIQTQEYRHQKGGPHEFGSLAWSLRF
jgi:hypothetical protein